MALSTTAGGVAMQHPFKRVLDLYCSDALQGIYNDSDAGVQRKMLDALGSTCEQAVLAGIRARESEGLEAMMTPTAVSRSHAVMLAFRATSKSQLKELYPRDDLLQTLERSLLSWGRTRPLKDIVEEAAALRAQLRTTAAAHNVVTVKRSDTTVRKDTPAHNYHENLRNLQRFEKINVADMRLFQTMTGKVLEGTIVTDPVGVVGIQVVMKDATGQHVELGLYNQMEKVDLDAAAALFPVGARICVVEPFLKVFRNGACGVRVDNPAEVMVFVDGAGAAARVAEASWVARLRSGARSMTPSSFFDFFVASVHQASAPGLGGTTPITHTDASRTALMLSNQAQCYLHLGLPHFALLKAAAALFLRPTVVVASSQGDDDAPPVQQRATRAQAAGGAPVDKALQRYRAALKKLRTQGQGEDAGSSHVDPSASSAWRDAALGRCAAFVADPHALYTDPGGDDFYEEVGFSLEAAHKEGNEAFRAGRHREALTTYQEGIVGLPWRADFLRALVKFIECSWDLRLLDHVLAGWACAVCLLDFPTSAVTPLPRAARDILAQVNPFAVLALVGIGDGGVLAPIIARDVPEDYAGLARLCDVVMPSPPPAYARAASGAAEPAAAATARLYPFRTTATAAYPLKELMQYSDAHSAMLFTPSFGAAVDAKVVFPQWAHDGFEVRKTQDKGRGVFCRGDAARADGKPVAEAGDVVLMDVALVLGRADHSQDKDVCFTTSMQKATIADTAAVQAEGAWVFRHGRDRYACRCARFIHHGDDDRGNLRPLVQLPECFNNAVVEENAYAPFLCFEEEEVPDSVAVECGADGAEARLTHLLSMLALNAFGDGEVGRKRAVGLYPAVSMVNHGDAHNAVLVPLHMQGQPGREVALMVVANRPIYAGEELTICYTEDPETLRSKWNIAG